MSYGDIPGRTRLEVARGATRLPEPGISKDLKPRTNWAASAERTTFVLTNKKRLGGLAENDALRWINDSYRNAQSVASVLDSQIRSPRKTHTTPLSSSAARATPILRCRSAFGVHDFGLTTNSSESLGSWRAARQHPNRPDCHLGANPRGDSGYPGIRTDNRLSRRQPHACKRSKRSTPPCAPHIATRFPEALRGIHHARTPPGRVVRRIPRAATQLLPETRLHAPSASTLAR
ncbi:hypothetical protein BJY52DRAFT_1413749 [Lactarius psammicola]|nr:hypothetical protein BJY52DRAFT_1413749 [Lactarius psammicola]